MTNFVQQINIHDNKEFENFVVPKKHNLSNQKIFKNYTRKCNKTTCNLNESKYVLKRMPEAFKEDEKSPVLLSLPILQRIGRLDILREEIDNQQLKKISCSELNYEHQFFSLKQKVNLSKKQFYITLGLNKEDTLLNIQSLKTKRRILNNSNEILSQNASDNKNFSSSMIQLTFSIILIKKLNISRKLLFSLILILLSYLSLL